jgi:protein-tyrosine phosphatase
MAEGILRRLLADAGMVATVASAGLLPGGSPATGHAVAVMADRGIDVAGHRSRPLDRELAQATPIIIGMARHHVREACVTYGAPIERTFTLKELVRRGEQAGPRGGGETAGEWLARVGAGRRTADLMGEDPADDVADPVGHPRADYEDTADELSDLLVRLVRLLAGTPTPSGGPPEPGRRGRWRLGPDPARARR